MIEILRAGAMSSIQDGGRLGMRRLGITAAGAIDTTSLSLANLLVGNLRGAAAIEIVMPPLEMRFSCDTRIAVTGADVACDLDGVPLQTWWSVPVAAGQVLRVRGARAFGSVGTYTYVAVAGGIDVELVLGSRSTDLKSGFGGLHGRLLASGDRLPMVGDGPMPPPASAPSVVHTLSETTVALPDTRAATVAVSAAAAAAAGGSVFEGEPLLGGPDDVLAANADTETAVAPEGEQGAEQELASGAELELQPASELASESALPSEPEPPLPSGSQEETGIETATPAASVAVVAPPFARPSQPEPVARRTGSSVAFGIRSPSWLWLRRGENGRAALVDIRFMPGPEWEDFSIVSRRLLSEEPWEVTPQSNRIGYRLSGPKLVRLKTKVRDLLSHGVLPGVIQVPPDGQPIVLMADAQTTGGYPKIGVVISADLALMAQVRLGSRIRFVACEAAQALQALRDERTYLDKVGEAIATRMAGRR